MKYNMTRYNLDVKLEDAKIVSNIEYMDSVGNQLLTRVLDTENELIKQKLIELGWTPPKGN